MKKRRRLFSIVCAAVLAASGLTFSGAGGSAITVHADGETELNANIFGSNNSEEFEIGDTSEHEFRANLELYDEAIDAYTTVDDGDYTPTYSWSLENGANSLFQFVGSPTGKNVKIKLKSNAKQLLGNNIFYRDGLILTATTAVADTTINSCGLSIILKGDNYPDEDNVSITPDGNCFDNNHKSVKFTVSGLDAVDASKVDWSFADESDSNLFTMVKNGKEVTVTLKNDAATKWEAMDHEEGADNYYNELRCEMISSVSPSKDTIRTLELRYYPGTGGMFAGAEAFIADYEDAIEGYDEYSFYEGDNCKFYVGFDRPGIRKYITNPVYAWSLDSAAANLFEIVGASNGYSVTVRPKADAASKLGNELYGKGTLLLKVKGDDLPQLTKTMDITFKRDVDVEFDQDAASFSNEYTSRNFKILNANELDLNKFRIELTGDDLCGSIFDCQRNGQNIAVKLKPNAANVVAANNLAETDEDGNKLFYACLNVYMRSSTGNTEICVCSLDLRFYLEKLYEVTYNPTEAVFTKGTAAEKTVKANVVHGSSETITYEWSLNNSDKEAKKCFTLAGVNSDTVKVRYNGQNTEDTWFALSLKIRVNGKVKPLSAQTQIVFAEVQNESGNNDNGNSGGGNNGNGNAGGGNNGNGNDGGGNNGNAGNNGNSGDVNNDNSNNGNTNSNGENNSDQDRVDVNNGNTAENSQNPGDAASQSTAKVIPQAMGSVLTRSDINGTFTVTSSAEGAAAVAYSSSTDKKAKKVSIPATVTDENGIQYTVTSIGEKAFNKNKKLKSLVFPNTITKISKNAVYKCKKLSKITVYGDNLQSVEKGAFKNLKKGVKVTVVAKDKKTYKNAVKMLKKGGLKNATFKYKKTK